jgi:hypothetical protein
VASWKLAGVFARQLPACHVLRDIFSAKPLLRTFHWGFQDSFGFVLKGKCRTFVFPSATVTVLSSGTNPESFEKDFASKAVNTIFSFEIFFRALEEAFTQRIYQ